MDYKEAGVDVTRGYKAVELIKKHTASTFNENVLGDLGSFGGFYSIAGEKVAEPVLVAGTDGVGTKLKYAFITGRHDTIGIDCVAMCVNDVVCQGAKPLFFLDYYAVGRLYPEVAEKVVAGVAEGCRQSGCALIGGETAEMPGFYAEGEYDLAGFCVGIADKKKIINGERIVAGDVLVGLGSTGVHSNGYSLIRKLFGRAAYVAGNGGVDAKHHAYAHIEGIEKLGVVKAAALAYQLVYGRSGKRIDVYLAPYPFGEYARNVLDESAARDMGDSLDAEALQKLQHGADVNARRP